MTANDSPEDRDVCLRAGMDDYLVKPIQAVVVLAAIERWSTNRTPAAPRRGTGRHAGRAAVSDQIARLQRELENAGTRPSSPRAPARPSWRR